VIASPAAGPYQSISSTRSKTVRARAAKNLATVDVCAYCRQVGTTQNGPDLTPWHYDHVMPLAKGGEDATWNVVKACSYCNLAKGAHFQWPAEGTLSGDGGRWNAVYLQIDDDDKNSCLKESLRTVRLNYCRQAKNEVQIDTTFEGGSPLQRQTAFSISQAQIWWLSEDLGHLIERAAATLPQFQLQPEHLPDKHGLCFFERPLVAPRRIAIAGDLRAYVSAALWSAGENGMRVVFFSKFRAPKMTAQHWLPTGSASWMFGETQTGDRNVVYLSDLDDTVNDLNWIAALWSIAAEPRYVDCDLVKPNRPQRRQAQREGRQISDMKVVRLRSSRQPHGGSPQNGTAGYTHRFLVRGHWKFQPFGPGRAFRRPMYIDEYIKGPQGTPLVIKETVKAVS
jgi:hypothetical protein